MLYEIRSEPTTLGGAISILSHGLRLIDRLYLFNELVVRGSSTSELKVHSMRVSLLVDMDVADWSSERVGFGFMRDEN